MKQTQREFVIAELESVGEISRNYCLQRYITRLGAIICNLKKEGYDFITFTRENIKPDGSKGKDYVYQVIKKPFSEEERFDC